MFHVKHPPLFPNTEIPENHIQQIFDIDAAGDAGEGAGGAAQVFGD